jgi:hypothetical protein
MVPTAQQVQIPFIKFYCVRFEVMKMLTMKSTIYQDVMLGSPVEVCLCYGRMDISTLGVKE